MTSLTVNTVPPKPLLKLTPYFCRNIYTWIRDSYISLTSTQKVLLITSGFGLTIIGLASNHLKRKRRRPTMKSALKSSDPHRQKRLKPLIIRSPSGDSFTLRRYLYEDQTCKLYLNLHIPTAFRSNINGGELHSIGGPLSPIGQRSRSYSVSDRSSMVSQIGESALTPQQYGLMGLEALEGSIGLWEEALSSYSSGTTEGKALLSQEEAEFTQNLQRIIEEACFLQEQCEQLFLHQQSVLFKSFDITPDPSEAGENLDRRTLTSISSVESFFSAQADIADLREFDEFDEPHQALYMAALKHHEEVGIPYRDVRTQWVACGSDLEYVCKVHCLRMACQLIFSKGPNKEFFAEAGRNVIHALLVKAEKDPKEAVSAYDEMLIFLTECNWVEVEHELQLKGIKALTFYDVVLDFILMDAFDDLESPPSSVLAVVQNRWLSNSFKESALGTAVWSVIKAKRRMLRHRNGLIAHFYDITEHLSPVLAWGFLGSDHKTKAVCTHFKDEITGLLHEMFSFASVRYTTVEELSEDLMNLAKHRYKTLMEKFSVDTQINGFL